MNEGLYMLAVVRFLLLLLLGQAGWLGWILLGLVSL
jgi:hypothetical protein